jgi:pimeloyl-ACP methyl ester carboxylesterase
MPNEDRKLMDNARIRETFIADLKETFRQGLEGPVDDAIVQNRDWGFRHEAIRIPVHIWQGERDRQTPPEMARYQQLRIPSSKAFFIRDEARLGLVMRRGSDIFRGLAHA